MYVDDIADNSSVHSEGSSIVSNTVYGHLKPARLKPW
jgi:hypothetical protein